MGGCGSTSSPLPKSHAVQASSEDLASSQIYADDALSTNVEIHISCENLADKDVLSKSDPFAILYSRNKAK